MAYQEVTRTSYGSRVKSSFAGIGTGILLFFAGTALLWWNEGRAVKTTKMLEEAQGVTVEMPDVKKVNPEFEGQLVHATGLATTTDSLVDTQYGVGAVAIQLSHSVEYYQWVENVKEEKKDKLGGAQETVRTYTYEQRWTGSPVNSGSFKDPAYQGKNFTLHQAEDDTKYAENVTFGAYKLNESQIHSISKQEPLTLDFDDAKLRQWDTETGRIYVAHGGQPVNMVTNAPAVPAQQAANDSVQQPTVVKDLNYVHIADNVLYFGVSPSSPQIGDVRVTFKKVMPTTVSILATVTGDTFKPFKAKNGKTLQVLSVGSKSSDEMYESEHQTNTIITWLLRLLGVMMVVGGLKGVFGFIETLLKVVPFVANIVGFGVNTICTVVGVVWSLIVIAIAWLFYRPLLGILLLAFAAFLIWVFAFKGKDKLKQMANRGGSPIGPQPAPAPQQAYQQPQQPQQPVYPQQPQYQQPQQPQYQQPQQPQYQQPQQPQYQQPQQPQYQQPQQPQYQQPQQPQYQQSQQSQYQQPQQPVYPQQPQQYQQPYPQQPQQPYQAPQQYNEDFEDVQ